VFHPLRVVIVVSLPVGVVVLLAAVVVIQLLTTLECAQGA